jgi:hypothetical protein
MTILSYKNADSCSIEFDDGLKIDNIQYARIKEGTISNPNHPTVWKVGYLGEGKYISREGGKLTVVYLKWSNMLERCYSEEYHKKQPTYIGCSVDERWHNFQVFAKWFEENYIEGYELDKDILLKGNKIYSPETCCFVPKEINLLFKGHKNGKIYPPGVNRVG